MPVKKCSHGIRTAYCKVCGGSAICKTEGCVKRALFAEVGKTATRCRLHKETDMVDTVHKMCKYEGCMKIASYALRDANMPEYCTTHKGLDMMNIVSRHCDAPGCAVRPNFALPGAIASKCATHKLDGMVNVRKHVCLYPECTVSASFSRIGERKLLYCSTHKEDGMTQPYLKYCEFPGCLTLPTYANATETKARFCSAHKTSTMIDVKNPYCPTLGCGTSVSHHINKGYCIRCFVHLFPDEKNACNYKTKEKTVVDFIRLSFPHLTIINDKRIEDGCSKRRPDILIDL
jgi:hypothetical protein